jgi:hypothetical protein
MTAAFRAAVTATGASSSAAATVPGSIAAGDVMLLVVSFKAAFPGASVNTPAGWAVLAGPVNLSGATGQGAAYTRVADGTDAGTTLTVTGTGAVQQLDYALVAWSGSNGTIRASGFTDQGVSSTSIACASQTSIAGDLIVAIAATRGAANGAYTFTAPAGYAVEAQVSSASGAAQNVGAVICDGTATGTQTITASIAVWSIAGQVVIEATNVPLAQNIRHRAYPTPARRRTAQLPPATQVPAGSPVRPRPKPVRRRAAQSTPPQGTPPLAPHAPRRPAQPAARRRPNRVAPPAPPVPPAARARARALRRPASTGRQLPPQPVQIVLPYAPPAGHVHRVLATRLTRRRPSGQWVPAGQVSCTVVRPDTGTVTRATTGYVIRPDTGTVDRPGCD